MRRSQKRTRLLTSNSEQENIFSDSEQEDLFGEDEDDTSVESAIRRGDRHIKGVVIARDGMAWINISARVAQDLTSVGN
jgi:Mg2+/Co2+ transporter CorC